MRRLLDHSVLFCLEIVCPKAIANGYLPSNCGARVGDNCSNFTCNIGFQRAGTLTSLICMNSGEWNNDVSTICTGIPFIVLMLSCNALDVLINF